MNQSNSQDPQPDTPQPPTIPPLAPQEQRTMGMLCHLLALAGLIGVPFGNILGPLIIWLIKKNEMPFVDDQGKESVNFQITALIAMLVLGIPTCGIGAIVVLVAALVFSIIGAVAANKGMYYRYPYCWRLIK